MMCNGTEKTILQVRLPLLFLAAVLACAVGCSDDNSGTDTTNAADSTIPEPDADASTPSDTASQDSDTPDSGDGDDDSGADADADSGDEDTSPPEPGACNDGVDSDGDGLVDWMYDLGCYGPEDDTEEALSREEENGWTTMSPSSDSRIIYVSSSQGDDDNDGLSPDTPVATLDKGLSMLRDGYPDWMLLRRGDVWQESLGFGDRSGRSADERMVVASYGASTERPMLKTGSEMALPLCCGAASNLAFLDLDFYAHTRDPDSPDFAGPGATEGSSSIRRCCGDGGNLLFEGMRTRFYGGMVLQTGNGHPENLEFRRNVVFANHPTAGGGHSQGLFASHVEGFLVEENVFDLNGWHPDIEGAEATMFNHNMYLSGGSDLVVRGNLFLRASSMGVKMRSDVTEDFQRILFEDNLFYDGELGLGIGGNTDEPYRFIDTEIRNNVFLEIGKSNPTGRNFAWMLSVSDHRNTTIEGNYFLHQPWYNNAYGINLNSGTQENISIEANTFYNLASQAMVVRSDAAWSDVRVAGNAFQDTTLGSHMIRHEGPFSPLTYLDNIYYSSAVSAEWFRIDSSNHSYQEWLTASGEQGSSVEQLTFSDPDRRLADYHGSLGRDATTEAFLEEARKQSKFNWRPEYTGAATNEYIRAGFETSE